MYVLVVIHSLWSVLNHMFLKSGMKSSSCVYAYNVVCIPLPGISYNFHIDFVKTVVKKMGLASCHIYTQFL